MSSDWQEADRWRLDHDEWFTYGVGLVLDGGGTEAARHDA